MTTMTTTPYEYLTVRAPRERELLYRDSYANLGWSLESEEPGLPGSRQVVLRLKRDRRLRERQGLALLQRSTEQGLAEIEQLEQSKRRGAAAIALAVGLVGAAFLAVSVVTLAAALPIAIVAGAFGLALWGASPFAFATVARRRVRRVEPQIDRAYETVYAAGEQASRAIAR